MPGSFANIDDINIYVPAMQTIIALYRINRTYINSANSKQTWPESLLCSVLSDLVTDTSRGPVAACNTQEVDLRDTMAHKIKAQLVPLLVLLVTLNLDN